MFFFLICDIDRDIQPREPVLDHCILFLLNSQYWLCFFNADIPLPFWRVRI